MNLEQKRTEMNTSKALSITFDLLEDFTFSPTKIKQQDYQPGDEATSQLIQPSQMIAPSQITHVQPEQPGGIQEEDDMSPFKSVEDSQKSLQISDEQMRSPKGGFNIDESGVYEESIIIEANQDFNLNPMSTVNELLTMMDENQQEEKKEEEKKEADQIDGDYLKILSESVPNQKNNESVSIGMVVQSRINQSRYESKMEDENEVDVLMRESYPQPLQASGQQFDFSKFKPQNSRNSENLLFVQKKNEPEDLFQSVANFRSKYTTKESQKTLLNEADALLYENQCDLFKSVCLETNVFKENKKHAKTWKKIQKMLVCKDDESRDEAAMKISQKVMKKYTKSKSLGMSLYLRLQDERKDIALQIVNPQAKIDLINKVIEGLRRFTPPKNLEEVNIALIETLRQMKFESIPGLLEEAYKINHKYWDRTATTLQQIDDLKKLIQTQKEVLKIEEFFENSPEVTQLKDEIQKCLSKDRNRHLLLTLIYEVSKIKGIEAFNLYDQVFGNDRDKETLQRMLINIAPIELKGKVKELLDRIDIRNDGEDLCQDESFFKILEYIYYTDAKYYKSIKPIILKEFMPTETLPQLKDVFDKCRNQLREFERIIGRYQHPQGSKLSIADFMRVSINENIDKIEKDIVVSFQKLQRIDTQLLVRVLFDYVKKKKPFSYLIQQLEEGRGQDQQIITSQSLFLFLYNCSDDELRTQLLITCSKYMPVPLIYQRFSQVKKKQDRSAFIIQNLLYSFEKRRSVMSFKVSSNPNIYPRGSTSLLNQSLVKSFDTHSMGSYGSVDIQFDTNFTEPLFIPVADAHGVLDESIREKLYPLFDYFIIHFFDHDEQSLQQCINRLETVKNNKNFKIILIKHISFSSGSQPNFSQEHNDCDKIATQIAVTNLIQLTQHKMLFENLCKIIKTLVFKSGAQEKQSQPITVENQERNDLYAYQEKFERRIYSIEQFLSTVSQFVTDKKQIDEFAETIKTTKRFMNIIKANEDRLFTEGFIPLIAKSIKLSHLTYTVKRDLNLKQVQREKLIKEIEKLRNELKVNPQKQNKKDPSIEILQAAISLVRLPSIIGPLNLITKLLRSFLKVKIDPFIEAANSLQSQLQKQDEEEDKNELLKSIGRYQKEIDKRQFSIEHVFRELYLYEKYSKGQLNEFNSLNFKLLEQGQPIEIIDGNTLSFIHNDLSRHTRKSERVLVVSVLGPQSSGKSLLLNYLFGTQFLSASGRCTKGIYATMIEIEKTVNSQYDKIIIIDSEGIQSAEARQEIDDFDKRIVLYILCVSHVVLICNKGELNQNMSELIKMAADIISDITCNHIKQPQVNIIMNMLSETDDQAMFKTVQKLNDQVIDIDLEKAQAVKNGKSPKKLLKISKENVFMLPFAFQQTMIDEIVVNNPSINFSKAVEPLRQRILGFSNSHGKNVSHDQTDFTFESWLEFALGFWGFVQDFQGNLEFSSFAQRKQDRILSQKIQQIIQIHIENDEVAVENDKAVQKLILEITQKRRGCQLLQVDKIHNEARIAIESFLDEKICLIQQEFNEFVSEKQFDVKIVKKREDQILSAKNDLKNRFLAISNKIIQDFSKEKQELVGEQRIQEAINRLLIEKDTYTETEAIFEFNQAWSNIELDIMKMLKQPECIQEEAQRFVKDIYVYQIQSESIKNHKAEALLFQNYNQDGCDKRQVLADHAEAVNHDPIVRRSNPNYNRDPKILLPLSESFIYLKSMKGILYKKEDAQYIDFQKYLYEKIDFDRLYQKLCYLIDSAAAEKGFFYHLFNPRPSIKQMIDSLKRECQHSHCRIREKSWEQIEFLWDNLKDKMKDHELTLENVKFKFGEAVHHIKEDPLNWFYYEEPLITNSFQNPYFIKKGGPFENFKIRVELTDREQKQKYDALPSRFKYLGLDNRFQIGIRQDELEKICDNDIFSSGLLHSYIQQLVEPTNQRFDDWKKTWQIIYKQLDKRLIVQKIESIILTHMKSNAQVDSSECCEKWLKKLDGEMKNGQPVNQLLVVTRTLIQSVVKDVVSLIEEINQELELLQVELSSKGKWDLHLIAQTILASFKYRKDLINEIAPITQRRKKRIEEQQLFVAKLTSNDPVMDCQLALNLASEIVQVLIAQCRQEIKNLFSIRFHQKENLFKSLNISQSIELQAYQEAQRKYIADQAKKSNITLDESAFERNSGIKIDEIVQFYIDPKRILSEKFEKEWIDQQDKQIIDLKQKYEQMKNLEISKLVEYFTGILALLKERKSCITSTSLFVIKLQNKKNGKDDQSSTDSDQEQSQKLLKHILYKAAAEYLVKLISGGWKAEGIINIEGVGIKVHDEYTLPVNGDLSKQYKDQFSVELQNKTIGYLTGQQTSNLGNFLEKLISALPKVIYDQERLQPLQTAEIVSDSKQKFRQLVYGCEECCPLCRRRCDVDHNQLDLNQRIHECKNGHQLQSFGGARHQRTDEALLIGCNELSADAQVQYKGKTMNWSQFKMEFSNWNFDKESSADKEQIRERNVFIWNLIGQKLCQMYKQKHGLDILFVKAHEHIQTQVIKTHFIFLLDCSGSMYGTKWADLTKAVEIFISKLEQRVHHKMNSKVTVITYNTATTTIEKEGIPSKLIVENVRKYKPEGGTNFNAALDSLLQELNASKNRFDKFVVCFMSDGESRYPQAQIDLLKKDGFIMSKLDFTSILYGSNKPGLEVLTQMANELKGNVRDIIEPQHLSDAFVQLIPNVYGE